MEILYGHKPLVEVIMMEDFPFNRPQMVDLLLQAGQNLSEMVRMMSG